MNTQTMTASASGNTRAGKTALDGAAKFWFLVTLAGQAIFSFYIVGLYYTATVTGNLERFNSVMPGGIIEDDLWGNIAVVIHVLFAATITFGGTMQLIPWLRSKAGSFHKWNGRFYVFTALFMSLSGIWMLASRGTVGDWFASLSITINGFIIMICALQALRYARARKFDIHRRWALRLFVAVSGVWFFRIGLMLWLMIHGAPVGFDPKTFTGPFLMALQVTVYILPLAVLEIYLRVHKSGTPVSRHLTTLALTILSIAMIGGIFSATMGMWLPRI